MGLLDTLIGTLTGKFDTPDASANPLGAALMTLLAQNGGIQGLMGKFSQGGLGDVFSSWVGMGENKSISPDQIKSLLGSQQMQALASNLGVDSSRASGFLAETTCRRSWTSSHRAARWTRMPITRPASRRCFPHSCRASAVAKRSRLDFQLVMNGPPEHPGPRPDGGFRGNPQGHARRRAERPVTRKTHPAHPRPPGVGTLRVAS